MSWAEILLNYNAINNFVLDFKYPDYTELDDLNYLLKILNGDSVEEQYNNLLKHNLIEEMLLLGMGKTFNGFMSYIHYVGLYFDNYIKICVDHIYNDEDGYDFCVYVNTKNRGIDSMRLSDKFIYLFKYKDEWLH